MRNGWSTVYCAIFIVYFPNIRGENGTKYTGDPKFLSTMVNASVVVGRDAALSCHISHSEGFKVAWVRVDTQTVLTMSEHVITKNHRIRVSEPDSNVWRLEISDIRRTDAGHYMCQINTDPMQSQLAYLDVMEPPSILPAGMGTSHDQTVGEGEDVMLACKPEGHPPPRVNWRREDGLKIRDSASGRYLDMMMDQQLISLTSVTRRDSGAYLCIASNGVPPAVSRRIMLEVMVAPVVSLEEELVTAQVGTNVRLGCSVEANPDPILSWANNNRAITKGGRFEIYKEKRRGFVDTSLIISGVNIRDHMTSYICSGRNSLGAAEKTVTLQVFDDGPVTQHREEEEIIFSNPQNNHPTLEIIEIEIPKTPEHNRKHKYSDSSSPFDDFQIKTEMDEKDHHRENKRKRKKFKTRTFSTSRGSSSVKFGISIIFPIVCLKWLLYIK